MGYRDVRANESRVRTRITDSGSGRETTAWDYYYMENRVRVVMGTEVGFRSQMQIWGWMPRTSGRDS